MIAVVSMDEDLENADWTKQSWDLPPYKSTEFMHLFHDLDKFRASPVYRHAVTAGLIANDEWVSGVGQLLLKHKSAQAKGAQIKKPP